mgnify:CR=1 FL=1
MMSLHLLALLENNGFGTIDFDLWNGELPMNKTGIALIPRGGSVSDGGLVTQDFDLYARAITGQEIAMANLLEDIFIFLHRNCQCTLPPYIGCCEDIEAYKLIDIKGITPLEDLGRDLEGNKLYRWAYQIKYVKE